jgi:lipopolysaccharide transport system permease protein
MNPLISEILSKRRQILGLAAAELNSKVKGSILGIALIILYPILFAGIYVGAYSYAFKATLPGLTSSEYIIYVLTGLIPFLYFSEVIGTSTQLFRSYSSVLRNTPVTHAVLSSMLSISALPPVLILLGTLSFVQAITNGSPLVILFFFAATLLLFLVAVSFSLIISVICAIIKDLVTLMPLLLLSLLMLTPIAYALDKVPAIIKLAAMLNPVLPVIQLYRSFLIKGYTTYYGFSPWLASIVLVSVVTTFAAYISKRSSTRILDLT